MSPEGRKETRHISFTQEPWGRETAVPNSSDGETEARRCRDLAKATNHVRDEDEVDSRAFYHMPCPYCSTGLLQHPHPPPTHLLHPQTRLTFLGYLPQLKGNFEGLGYCEGDSLGLKNRKWSRGRGTVLGR